MFRWGSKKATQSLDGSVPLAAAAGPIGELGRRWPQATLDSRKHVWCGICSGTGPIGLYLTLPCFGGLYKLYPIYKWMNYAD